MQINIFRHKIVLNNFIPELTSKITLVFGINYKHLKTHRNCQKHSHMGFLQMVIFYNPNNAELAQAKKRIMKCIESFWNYIK